MSVLDLCVQMDSAGCARKIRKILENVRGVDDVEVDTITQRVTVTGYVDQRKILRAMKKAGMKAVLWPYRESSEYERQPDAPYLNHDHHPATMPSHYMSHNRDPYYYYDSSNGYAAHVNDFNSNLYGYYYVERRVDTMRSDDEPGSCAIM